MSSGSAAGRKASKTGGRREGRRPGPGVLDAAALAGSIGRAGGNRWLAWTSIACSGLRRGPSVRGGVHQQERRARRGGRFQPVASPCDAPSPAPAGPWRSRTARPSDGRGTRRAAAGLLAALAALLVLPALTGVAHAQEPVKFLSNTGQEVSGGISSIIAQAFTTGSNAGGYTLTSVDVGLALILSDSIRVQILGHDDGPDTSNVVATLTSPATLAADAVNTFTAPANTVLAVETPYYVHVTNGAGTSGFNQVQRTATGAKDGGAAEGWTLGGSYTRSRTTRAWVSSGSLALIAVYGTAVAAADTTLPGAPREFAVTAGFAKASLTWTAPESVGGSAITAYQYKHKRGTGDYGDWKKIPDSATLTAYDETFAVVANADVTYRLRAVNDDGGGAASEAVTVTFASATIGFAETTALEVSEGAGTADLALVIETASNSPAPAASDASATFEALTARLGDAAGHAQPGGDYTSFSDQVTVAASDYVKDGTSHVASKTLSVTLVDDSVAEADESFAVQLQRPPLLNGYFVISDSASRRTITILDDDSAPVTPPATPTGVKFLSNTGQEVSGGISSIIAQAFTTGSNAGGYTLTSVDVGLALILSDSIRVQILGHDDGPDTSNVVATLTSPATLAADAVNTFTAPANTVLAVETPYYVHVTNGAGTSGFNQVQRTATGAKDGGAAEGWTLGGSYTRSRTTRAWVSSGSLALIAVYGTAVAAADTTAPAPDTTAPALESATVTEDGTEIELVFDEAYSYVSASNLSPTIAFSVTADGNSVTFGIVELEESDDGTYERINLERISPVITAGQTVVVTYTDPTTGDDTAAIEDAAGNDVATFTTGSGGVPAVVNNVPDLPAATIEAKKTRVTEGEDITITVRLSPTAFTALKTIPLTVTDANSALSGTAPTGFTIAANESERTLTFATSDNSDPEGARKVTFEIGRSADDPYTLGTPSTVTVTVLDNDGGLNAPTNVVASQEVEAVELTWTEPLFDGGSAITGYEYRQRKEETHGYGPWQEIPGAAAGTDHHTVAGLDGGTRYVFELRAVNAQGKGAASRPASATPFAVLAPDAPGRLAATGYDGTVVLELGVPVFDGHSPIVGYQYRYKEGETGTFGPWTEFAHSGTDFMHHTVTGLVNDTLYVFEVRAVNARLPGASRSVRATPSAVGAALQLRAGPGSPAVDAVPLAAPGPAEPALRLEMELGGTVTYQVRHLGCGGRLGLHVQPLKGGLKADGGHGGWCPPPLSYGEWRDVTLSSGKVKRKVLLSTPFEARVAHDVWLDSDSGVLMRRLYRAGPVAVRVGVTPTLAAVEALGLSLEGGEVRARWAAPVAGASGHQVQWARSTDPIGPREMGNPVIVVTEYLVAGSEVTLPVRYGEQLTVRVRAYGRRALGPWMRAVLLRAPRELAAVARSETAVGLAWQAPALEAGATVEGYRIEVSEDGGASFSELVADTQTAATGYDHEGLEPGARLCYRVSALGRVRAEGWSEVANTGWRTRTVCTAAGPAVLSVAGAEASEETDGTLEFLVRLNRPASGRVTVDYASADGTATAGEDYTAVAGTLIFRPGETGKTVAVTLLDDTANEGAETVTLRLENLTGGGVVLSGGEATGTILDRELQFAGFVLVDAATETEHPLADGAELELDAPARGRYVVRADTVADTVLESMILELVNEAGKLLERRRPEVWMSPYTLLIPGRALPSGSYTLTAWAYSERDGRGEVLDERVVTFKVRAMALPALSVAGGEAREGEDELLEFAVTLDRAAPGEVRVDYATEDGAATAGADYEATSGTLIFEAGETAKTVAVPILDDTVEDSGETFTLALSKASGATILDGEATGTIVNTEEAAALTARFEGLPATHGGSGTFAFRVRFSEAPALSFRVLRDESFEVEGGAVRKARRVDGRDDLREIHIEPAGAGTVTLRLAGGRACGTAGAVCTADGRALSNTLTAAVHGPGSVPAVSVSAGASPVPEGAEAGFALSRSGPSARALTVTVAVSEDGAMLAPAPGGGHAVTFAAGSATASLAVATVDDGAVESASTVTASLSPGAGYTVAPGGAAAAVTVADDDAAPALDGAAVSGAALTLAYDAALDAGSVPAPDAFAVAVAGAARGVDAVAVAGGAVTLTLASAVAEGQTVAVSYTVPGDASAARIADMAGNAAPGFVDEAVANETAAPVNAAPSGLPAIAGTAREGEVLRASVEGIADADGLDGATFAYRWFSNDGTGDEAIGDAVEAAYTVAGADVGRTLRVRVTFTDGGGSEETLVSAPTAPVAAAPVAVSVAAVSSPVTEGGAASFTLTRSGDAPAALTVAVRVSEAGRVLAGAAPEAATFAAGASTAALSVATDDDAAAEADGRVRVSVAPGAGYAVADGAASVDVFDNDRAAGPPPETPAETVLWSATLAVVDYENGTIGSAGAEGLANEAGSAGLAAKWLWYYTPERKLRLAFGQGVAGVGDLTLHLGDVTLGFPAGSEGSSGFTWADVDLDWAHGDTLAVRVTRAAGVEAPAAPGVSVADAQVREAAGAVLAFRVTLDGRQGSAVSVRYATSNETAAAGSDYVAASGAVRFEAGQTARTVSVRVLEDAHDEGSETLTLTLSAPFGAELSDATATGTIVNSDPVPKAWLARFGRTVAGHVVDAIGTRLTGPAGGGSHVTLGGQRLSLEGGAGSAPPGAERGVGDDAAAARDGLAALAERIGGADGGVGESREEPGRSGDLWGDGIGAGADGSARTMTGRELLLGSSFQLSAGGDGDAAGAAATRLTAWGRAASSRFDGDAEGLALDGEVTTFTLGADAAWSRWLAGVAVALSEGAGGFRDHATADHESRGSGELSSTLTSVHPYLRYEASERLSVWGILGYGSGELELELDGGERWSADTAMEMAAAGARGVLVPARETGGFELAARTDAQLVRMRSEAATGSEGGNLDATRADTSRLRLVLEGSRTFALGEGGGLTPSLEAGLRHDGGDAETGTGVELGAGLRYTDPASGLTVDARVRGLVAHEDADYREWGASGSVRIEPGPSGRGLSLSLTPAWGVAEGGAERLWSLGDARGLAANDAADPGSRLEAELGYGLSVLGGRAVATPWAGMTRSGGSETLRLGQRLSKGASEWSLESAFGDEGRIFSAGYAYRLGDALSLSLEASRREAANDDAPEHGVMLRVGARW